MYVIVKNDMVKSLLEISIARSLQSFPSSPLLLGGARLSLLLAVLMDSSASVFLASVVAQSCCLAALCVHYAGARTVPVCGRLMPTCRPHAVLRSSLDRV